MTANPLSTLRALDRALVANGWPALSQWWMTTLERFLASTMRQLVLRVGRRGGKSSSLCRLAVAVALAYDLARIPQGDIGVVALISTTRDEANQRVRTIREMLAVVGIATRPVEHGIELADRRIAIKVYVATIAGVSGFTSILVIADEVAKWRDSDNGANPAKEVLASVRPTMATQPSARIILSSSPLGTEDAHARAYDEGDSDFQQTAFAETWTANPSVSEAETHGLEPDERIWEREYAAIAQRARLAAFDVDAVDDAFEPVELARSFGAFGVIDASSGKKDRFTYAVASWHESAAVAGAGERVLAFTHVAAYDASSFWSADAGERVVTNVAREMRQRGVRVVYADQREAMMIGAAFTRAGLRFFELPWTGPRKERSVTTVRRWLADRRLVIAKPHGVHHAKMRDELLAFEERIAKSSGGLTFGARRNGHDDFVALLLTAAMADQEPKENAIPRPAGSPTTANRMIEALNSVSTRDIDRRFRTLGGGMHDMPDFDDLRRLAR